MKLINTYYYQGDKLDINFNYSNGKLDNGYNLYNNNTKPLYTFDNTPFLFYKYLWTKLTKEDNKINS